MWRLVVVALLVLQAAFVLDHDAWTPDEPRVQELCRDVASGSWVVPYLNGEPFLEQPPFHEWCVGAAFLAAGPSTGAARAVSALAGVVALALTFLLGERLAGRRAGLLAAAALGTTWGFWYTTHRIVCDGVLTALVAGSGYASLRGLTSEGRERRAALAFAYALASLAFLTKNVVGLALCGVGFLAVLLALRDARLLVRAHLWLAPLVFAVVCGPYLVRLSEEVGLAGVRELVWENTLGRALGTREGGSHEQPPWYYLVHFPLNALPAGLLLVPALADFRRRRHFASRAERLAIEFPLAWIALGVLGLSCASGKRELYLVPLYPAAAVVAGVWLDRRLALPGASRVPSLLAAGLALVGVACPIGALVARRSFDVDVLVAALAPLPALAGLAAVRATRDRWDRPAAPWTALLLAFTGTVVVALAAFVPAVDREKALGPFLREAGRAVPADRPLHVFEPDETLRGAVPFYADRPATPVASRDELRARLSGGRDLYVIVFEKRRGEARYASVRELPHEVLLEVVRPRSRTLRLLRFTGR